MTITVAIERPLPYVNDVFVIKEHGARGVIIYPDGNRKEESDFPLSGISLYYSSKKHFVLANEHKERWIFSNVLNASVDLEQFGPEWRECCLSIARHEA